MPTSYAAALTELSRLSALVATYGVLLLVLLVARLPLIERELGHDTLVRWHRKVAPWTMALLTLHVVTVVWGYASQFAVSLLAQTWDLERTYPWVLPATVGFVLMLVASFTSHRWARSRMAYETWWVTHLYTYLALALAFGHQLVLGQAFVGHPFAHWFWIALYVAVLSAVLIYRVGSPLVRLVWHDLRVDHVIRESSETVSIVMTGRHLSKLPAKGGQFFAWRFLTPSLWYQAHPWSLSAAPDGRSLRITVKNLGDASAELVHLKPGTRVLAEGPYGAFTAEARHDDRVVLIAGGVGVAPIVSLLADLPEHADVDVLYRAPRNDSVVLHRDLDALAARRPHTRVRYLVGSRHEYPIDARALVRLIPDISQADVFVCGPGDLVDSVVESVDVIGVPPERIHHEAFRMHST